MKAYPLKSRIRGGYTLAEVLVATVLIGMAMGASLSLTSAIVVQEELSWRTTVALNYQENAARLWQLGLGSGSPLDLITPRLTEVMPVATSNALLSQALNSVPRTVPGVIGPQGALGTMETAVSQVTVRNYNGATVPAANNALIYRPAVR
jgi:prepilin-type N-terminal cleavage/methylation domain-containing protein